jgi:AraC-like DNA-binding protein
MPRISTLFARLIARELSPLGDPWPALLKGLQLEANQILQQPQMPLQDFNRLLENALEASNDPGLGLRFGRHPNLMMSGEAMFAAIAAPNLMEVMQAIGDFSRLQAEYIEMEVWVGLKKLRLRARETSSLDSTRRTQHEVMILSLQNAIELVLGRPFTEGRYWFSFPEPEYSKRYEEAFHCPCEFDADSSGIDIPRSLTQAPSPYFNQALWERGRNNSLALMTELNSRDRQLYSQHILSLLRGKRPPLPDLNEVARHLALSERTLLRRLHEEQQSYRDLRLQVVMEWADHYLCDTDTSVEAIAALLGYQDAGNFRRAFRRHFQCTPNEYRDQQIQTGK